MDCTLVPSLEHIILAKIATLLWNQADVRTIINWFPFFCKDKCKRWQEVENVVAETVSHLSLPKALRRHVLGSIKPIGNQIFGWLERHKNLYFCILHLPNELCWTVQGLLDSKKTAEALIQDQSLHIITRYKLACTYCLEKDIPELWNEIPENLQKLFYKWKYSTEFKHPEFLVRFWTHKNEGDLLTFSIAVDRSSWLSSVDGTRTIPYEWECEWSAFFSNKAAVEFFLQKLTSREREESLVNCIEYVAGYFPGTSIMQNIYPVFESYSNVLCFLLSQMDYENKLHVSERYPRTILYYLLDYPLQSFFVETAGHVRNFISLQDYDCLLNKIVLKAKEGFRDWNYSELFVQFWRIGTSPQKRYVFDECICGPLLFNLCKNEDMANISLLVHEATVEEKVEIVYYRKDIIVALIVNDEWNLLKLLFEHCLSSGDIFDKFQKEFQEHDLTSRVKEYMAEEKAILKKFLKSLNNLLIHIPRDSYCKVDWAKEEVRYVTWKRLKIRRKNEKVAIQNLAKLIHVTK